MPDLDATTLAPVLLADDLQLLWYDPIEGAPVRYSGRHGVPAGIRGTTLGAAMLVELLANGAAVLVPGTPARVLAKAVERGFVIPPVFVTATETPPARPELESAWATLRRHRRPRAPERVLARLRPRDPEARLVGAGVIEYPHDAPRRLSASGLAFARTRRAELDAVVLDGFRAPDGLATATVRLAALLSISEAWRGAYGFVDGERRPPIERRLAELRAEAESGPDGALWRAVASGMRRALARAMH